MRNGRNRGAYAPADVPRNAAAYCGWLWRGTKHAALRVMRGLGRENDCSRAYPPPMMSPVRASVVRICCGNG